MVTAADGVSVCKNKEMVFAELVPVTDWSKVQSSDAEPHLGPLHYYIQPFIMHSKLLIILF